MNSNLYGKTYKVPSHVIDHIRSQLVTNPNGNGIKRAKNIVNSGVLTYQGMKRIKNFFDNFNGGDRGQYELAGGDQMKRFIEQSLTADRDGEERSKDIKRDFKPNTNVSDLRVNKSVRINENDDADDIMPRKNALAVILDDEKQILLLKRSDDDEWMPGKWALVGGGVEDGEEPVEACHREIMEETGLKVTLFSHKAIIQRSEDNIEYIYVAKFDGDKHNINLDKEENSSYGWYSPEEIKFIDAVPNLIDYINIAFKNYD